MCHTYKPSRTTNFQLTFSVSLFLSSFLRWENPRLSFHTKNTPPICSTWSTRYNHTPSMFLFPFMFVLVVKKQLIPTPTTSCFTKTWTAALWWRSSRSSRYRCRYRCKQGGGGGGSRRRGWLVRFVFFFLVCTCCFQSWSSFSSSCRSSRFKSSRSTTTSTLFQLIRSQL